MRPWLAAALAAELGIWFLASALPDAHFAGFRILGHLGVVGLAAAVAAAITAGLAAPRLPGRFAPAAVVALALIVQALVWDLPQAQPDTLTYFVHAQAFAREPLETLIAWPTEVWGSDEGRFHKPFPLIPALYGAVFALFGETRLVADGLRAAFALACVGASWRLARALGQKGPGAAALVATLPLLAAQSAWILVDLPLIALLAVAWTAWLEKRWPLFVVFALLAMSAKFSAILFLAAPILFLESRRLHPAIVVGLGLVAAALLVVVKPPFWREEASSYALALGALALHLRPALLLQRPDRFTLGALLTLPLLFLYAPAEHLARYALPLVPLLAIRTAASEWRPLVPALVASGFVLFVAGYRPLLVHTQAANLQRSAEVLDDFERVEVWGDLPSTTFPTAALVGLLDLETETPVVLGETCRQEPPESKRHWWEFYEPPPWHEASEASDGALLMLYGGERACFEERHPDAVEIDAISDYTTSSWLLPREVVVYRLERRWVRLSWGDALT